MPLQSTKLIHSICEAWELGIPFSEMSEYLGVSRPTLYRMLERLREEGHEFLIYPNLEKLGLYLIIVSSSRLKGRGLPSGYMIEMRTIEKALTLYARKSHLDYVAEALRLFGFRVSNPFTLSYLVCPDGRRLTPERSRGPLGEAVDWLLIGALSERFTSIKDIAEKSKRPWQYVTWYIRRAKSKGLLVGPVFYRRVDGDGMVNVALELELGHPEDVVEELKGYSSLVVFESPRLSKLIVAATPFERLYSILDKYGRYVRSVYISKGFPLNPVKYPFLIMDGIKDSVRALEPLVQILTDRRVRG